jgi:hypothetical protein
MSDVPLFFTCHLSELRAMVNGSSCEPRLPVLESTANPWAAKALSMRIGTALINGKWFVRGVAPLTGRAVLMQGHRHVDWSGELASLPIVSAPPPVMEVTDDKNTSFYIHTLAIDADGKLNLLAPSSTRLETNRGPT